MNRHLPLAGLALAASALLSACGGGTGAATDDAPLPRGSVIYSTLGGSASTTTIDAATSTKGIQTLTGTAKCGVDIRYVYYMTRDPAGNATSASTALFVPSGTDASCTGTRPVLLYAHGTTTTKSFNMADVTNNTEGALVMAFYAAQGFVVVAPNYMGYDHSSLSYTPYLNAESSAVDMVDGLRAAKTDLAANTSITAGKLLISGYSQGGHVAMATQKIIERDYASEFPTLLAAGPMSGPYNLVGFGDVVVGGTVNAGATIFMPLMLTSYQKAYGNIYSSASEVYQSPFDQYAETLFPTDTSLTDLIAAGKLPADSTFTLLFGTGGLLTDSFKTGYSTSNFRAALTKNTLLDWTPKHPIAMCGGANDPTVFYAVNTTVAKTTLAAKGGASVTAYNLEDATSVGTTLNAAFTATKTAYGSTATANYHGTIVPPFCTALVRSYFQTVLAAAQ